MSVFYRNIKQKRIELRMTQTELAKKVGYSDKSMIARIERGDVDIPQSKIMLFANALNMTPCSLMGWNDYDSEELKKTREEIIELQKYITEMDEFGVTDEKAEHHMTQLQGHRGSPFDRVCPFNEGQRRAMWKSVKRAMNIAMGCRVVNNQLQPPYPLDPHFTMYNLRHTYCTDLERAGVPINVARRLMGHASIAITSAIYTHDNVESMESARDLINGTMGNSVGNNQRKAHG